MIRPSRVWISSISARPRPCAVPPSIWPSTAVRVERPADVLRGADPDDPGESEVDVHLGDDASSRARERDVRALAGDLAGLGIERRRRAGAGRRARRRPRRAVRRSRSSAPPGTRAHGASPPSTSCRDADAEPAEPTVAVVRGASAPRRCPARSARPGGSPPSRPARPPPPRSGPRAQPVARQGRARRCSRRSPPSSRCS